MILIWERLVEKCVSNMKNLKEIKLMMERLESPRLTETELNYKKSLLKEEDEEVTQDPDQLDLFTGETKEVNEKVEEFEELKRLILDEIEGLDMNYLHTAMLNGQLDSTLMDLEDLVRELEYWVDSNDFEGELMAEAENLLEVLEYGPVDYEITLTPEVEELLKRERPSIKVGSEKEISAMSEGKDKMSLLKEESRNQCYEIDLDLDSLIGQDLSKIFVPSQYRGRSTFGSESINMQDVFTPPDEKGHRKTSPKITQFYSYFCPRKRKNFPELKDDQFITFPSDTDVTNIYVGLDGGKITPVGLSGKVVDVSGNAINLHGRKGRVDRLSVYQNGKYIKSLDDDQFHVGNAKDSDTSVYDKIKSKLGEKIDPSDTKEIEMQ